MTDIIYKFLKTWLPSVYWKIYHEGETSAQKVQYKKHKFTPISEYKVLKFHLPVYKAPIGSGNSQPPAAVH